MKRWWALAAALLGFGALRAFRSRRAGPATVIYDGACPLCRRTVAHLQRWDTEGALRYLDGRNETALAARFPHLSGGADLREVRLALPDGAVLGGFDAVRAFSAMLPPLRWLSPFLYIPGMRPVGAAVYRFIAARRPQAFTCTDASCPVHRPSR